MDRDPSTKKIRILVAKPGVDGHRIGAELLCQAFRDAGMEVIYTGTYQMPAMIVDTAVQEDVDIIALSSLSWSSTADFSDVMTLMKERDLTIPVVGGGLIPEEDKAFLENIGVQGNYGPGTPLQKIIDLVVRTVKGGT